MRCRATILAGLAFLPSTAFAGVCNSGHSQPYWTFPYYVCTYSAGPNPPSYYVPDASNNGGSSFTPDANPGLNCSVLPSLNTVSCAGAPGSTSSSTQVAGGSDLSAIPSAALTSGIDFSSIVSAILATGALGIALLLAVVAVMYIRRVVRGGPPIKADGVKLTDRQKESWWRKKFDREFKETFGGDKYDGFRNPDDYEKSFSYYRDREENRKWYNE